MKFSDNRPLLSKAFMHWVHPRLGLWIGLAGLCLIGAVWLATLQMIRIDREATVQSVFKVEANMAKAFETLVTDRMDDADSVLRVMQRTFEKHGGIPAETRELMKEIGFTHFISQAAILDTRGEFIFSFNPIPPGINLADRPQFLAHVHRDSGDYFIGSVVKGRISGKSSFHMSRRINKPEGSFGGVASVAIDTAYFSEAFKRLTLEKMQFVLIGRDGIVRAADAESETLLGKNLKDGTVFQALRERPRFGEYRNRIESKGVPCFVSYRAVGNYPLIVVVSVSEELAMARFYDRRSSYFSMAVFISLVLLGMTALHYRTLRRQDRLSRKVLEEKERAENYLEMAGALIIATDLSGRVTLINRRGQEVLGYTEEELLGKDWFETVLQPERREAVKRQYQELIRGELGFKADLFDTEVLTSDGDYRTISWTNTLVHDLQGDVSGVLSSGVDVTQRRELEQELKRLAHTDSLTGVSTRRSFLEAGRREFDLARRYHKPLSLLLMDVDHFKTVNDTYGHAAGDLVLMRLADACRVNLRSVDLLGRFGGEEFVCLLPETHGDQALVVAERLRQALAGQVVEADTGDIRFTVSIGVAEAKGDDASLEEMLRVADAAMYVAKKTGRNRVVAG